MFDNVETCDKCSRPFSVSQIGGAMPGTKEPEEIHCPYPGCDWFRTEMSNGSFITSPLTPEQEAEYRRIRG